MWLQEPGSFTRIIAAIVAPRKTSRETIRPERAVSAAAKAFDVGAAKVSAVAMVRPSDDGDSTAVRGMPQRRGGAVLDLGFGNSQTDLFFRRSGL
jgi:hypothetical protein